MHLQIAIEGLSHFIEDYVKRLSHTKVRVDNTAYQVHVREIKIYDLVFEEKALNEVKAILPAKKGPSGVKARAIQKIAGFLGVSPVSPDDCGKKFREWNNKFGAGGHLHLNVFVLGTVKDRKKENGSDYL